MTKENICQVDVELSKARQKRKNPVKEKGKHRILLPELSDDEDKPHARSAQILEDAAKNKV